MDTLSQAFDLDTIWNIHYCERQTRLAADGLFPLSTNVCAIRVQLQRG